MKTDHFSNRNLIIATIALSVIGTAIYFIFRKNGGTPPRPAPSFTPLTTRQANRQNTAPLDFKKRFNNLWASYNGTLLETPPSVNDLADFTKRNRYNNIRPFKTNVFKFQEPSLYFNASCILKGRAIACQGPLEIEHKRFWRMVWESNTTTVIMATDLVE